jgi:hypothetical protein
MAFAKIILARLPGASPWRDSCLRILVPKLNLGTQFFTQAGLGFLLLPNPQSPGYRAPSKISANIKTPEAVKRKYPQILKLLVIFWAAACP